jgi:hypothetical protein
MYPGYLLPPPSLTGVVDLVDGRRDERTTRSHRPARPTGRVTVLLRRPPAPRGEAA